MAGLEKCRITKCDSGLIVQIDDVSGHERSILQLIRQCRHSAWACPSGECVNIESIDERVEDGKILLTLTPRPGAELNSVGIEQCLAYMLRQVIKM